jgi:hypothetical protein
MQDHSVAVLKMNLVTIVREAVVGRPLAYQCTNAAKTLFIDVCDHFLLRLPKIQDQKHCPLGDTHRHDGARRVYY